MNKRILAITLALLMILPQAMALEMAYDAQTNTLSGAMPGFLIKNLGTDEQPQYTKIAEVTIPEGLKDLGGLKSDPLEQNFFLVPADETSFADTILIMYMPGKKAEDMAAVYGQYQDFLSMTDAENRSFAGHNVHLRTLLHEEYDYDDMGNKTDLLGYYLSCATYTNAGDGALMVAVFTKTTLDPNTLPAPDTLYALLETLYSGIQLEKNFQ